MKIWVDADACPNVIKEIIFRAAERKKIQTVLVANQILNLAPSLYIKSLKVASGFDKADSDIVAQMEAGDIVITADIPLAADVIAKKGCAINPRGELYSEENIKAKLNMRDFFDSLRGSGIHTGGPSPLNQNDRLAFANQLDRLLAKYKPIP